MTESTDCHRATLPWSLRVTGHQPQTLLYVLLSVLLGSLGLERERQVEFRPGAGDASGHVDERSVDHVLVDEQLLSHRFRSHFAPRFEARESLLRANRSAALVRSAVGLEHLQGDARAGLRVELLLPAFILLELLLSLNILVELLLSVNSVT